MFADLLFVDIITPYEVAVMKLELS